MKKKDTNDSKQQYAEIMNAELNKVSDEYENDLQEFVVGLHRDVYNKFSHHTEENQVICGVSVMQYLLFNQICRIIAAIAIEGFWEDIFDNFF